MAHYLEISTVSVCKVGCKYCPQQLLYNKYGKKEYMTFDHFKVVIDKLPKYVTIDFAGYVEPFLNEAASDMMLYAYEQGFNVRLYSTLADCRETDIDKIRNIKFQSIVLHLPDIYGYMNIKVDDKYKHVAKLFKQTMKIDECHTYGPINESLREIFPEHVEKLLGPEHLHDRGGNVKTELFQLETKQPLKGPVVCGVVWRENSDKLSHNVLLPDGRVQSCCCDYGLENTFGNLLTDEYDDLFKSEGYIKMKKAMASEDDPILCRTCKEVYPDQPYR